MKYSVRIIPNRGDWQPFEDVDEVVVEKSPSAFDTDIHSNAEGKRYLYINPENCVAVLIEGIV